MCDFLFLIYSDTKPLLPKPKRKPTENVRSILFENKGQEYINKDRVLRDPEIVTSLPTLSVKFPMPMVTLKVVSDTFLVVCFLSLKESTCETRKNVFYFTSKAFFVLDKIKF